jgi:hypothetical protein
MAQQTKRHGDFKPVMNFDARDYEVGAINAAVSAATVQPQGPKLDFFTITLANVAVDGSVLKSTIDTIQQLATVYIYEVTDASTDTLAVAVYPTGAWTTATLDTATGGTSVASATFTN